MATVAVPQILTNSLASDKGRILGSTRFHRSGTNYLQRTPPSGDGNRWAYTISLWTRRGRQGADGSWYAILGDGHSSTLRAVIRFDDNDRVNWQVIDSSSWQISSNQRCKDSSAWFHIVCQWDSGNATSSERMKMWINGVRVTNFDVEAYPSQNQQSPSSRDHWKMVGARTSDGSNISLAYDGYITELYYVDGGILTADDFGYNDPLTNSWVPKKFNYRRINDGTVWSNYLTASAGSVQNASRGFNGYFTDYTNSSNNEAIITFTPPAQIKYNKFVEVHLRSAQHRARINGGPWVYNTGAGGDGKYLRFEGAGELRTLDVQYTSGSLSAFNGISIDGEVLMDSSTAHMGKHGLYLPLDGSAAIGKDQSGADNDFTPSGIVEGHMDDNDSGYFGSTVPVDMALKHQGTVPILKTSSGRNAQVGSVVNQDISPRTIPIIKDSGAVHFKGFAGSYADDALKLLNDGANMGNIGNSDFTLDAFIYIEDFGFERHYPIIQKGNGAVNNNYDWRLYIGDNTSENLYFDWRDNSGGGGTAYVDCGACLERCKWHHVAVVRSGTGSNNLKVYLDGVLKGQDSVGSDTVNNTYSELEIAHSNLGSTGDTYYLGWVSNVRLVIGSALYSGTDTTYRNFPEPEKKLTAVTGTQFLACQDPENPMQDNSGIMVSGPTLTNQNGCTASTDNPFGTGTDGSVSFTSSSSQKLHTPDHQKFHIGYSDATLEFWFKTSTPTQAQYLAGHYGSRNLNPALTSSGTLQVFADSGTGTTLTTTYSDLELTSNTWHHLAWVIHNNKIYAYLDGRKSRIIGDLDSYIKTGSNEYAIGQIGSLTGTWTNGLISNFRLVNGHAVYKESFTPPTSKLTAIPGTTLLACQSRTTPTESADVPRVWSQWGLPEAAKNECAGSCQAALPLDGSYYDMSHLVNPRNSLKKSVSQTSEDWDEINIPYYHRCFKHGDHSTLRGVTIAADPKFAVKRGAWTAEIWFRKGSHNANDTWAALFDFSTSMNTYDDQNWLALLTNSNQSMYMYYGTSGNSHTAQNWNFKGLNQWCHIAVTWDGQKLRSFLNGTRILESGTITNSGDWAGNRNIVIGRQLAGSNRYLDGYTQDFKFYNGCCKYKENFVVGSASFETNAVLPESPSPVVNSYDLVKPKTGSVRFHRAKESKLELQADPQAPGTGDLTIEAYIWVEAFHNYPAIWDTRASAADTAGFFWGVDSSGELYLYTHSGRQLQYQYLTRKRWYHVALVRRDGVFTSYVDGKKVGDYTQAQNYTNTLNNIGWTTNSEGLNWYWDGYLSNYRYCTSAVYTGEFKPSEEPLTATSQGATNCQLLCCNDTSAANGQTKVLTSSGKALTANGQATHSTDNPFGTTTDGSVVFDGSQPDCLSTPTHADWALTTDEWTYECWIKPDDLNSTMELIGGFNSGSPYKGFLVGIDFGGSAGDGGIDVWMCDTGNTQTYGTHGMITAGVWQHVAVVKSRMNGGHIQIYVDGKDAGGGNNSRSALNSDQPIKIGSDTNVTPSRVFKGKMSNVRFVKGHALYGREFTPPKAKLEAIPGTILLCCQSRTDATVSAAVDKSHLIPKGWAQPASHNPFDGGDERTMIGQEDTYAILDCNHRANDNVSTAPAEGGLYIADSGNNTWGTNFASIGMYPTSQGGRGKYYWETMQEGHNYMYSGVSNNLQKERNGTAGTWVGQSAHSWSWFHTNTGNGGKTMHSGSYETNTELNCYGGDIAMHAFDADSNKIWFGKNGVWYNGGNPVNATNASYVVDGKQIYFPDVDFYNNNGWINYGQIPYRFQPPEGYGPISVSRSLKPEIGTPQKYFAIRNWTGTGGTGTREVVSDLQFRPDLVFIKARTNGDTRSWIASDSVRGKGSNGAYWRNFPARTMVNTNDGYDITAISDTGFTVNRAGDYSNQTSTDYGSFSWRAGGGSDSQSNEFWKDGIKYASVSAAGMDVGSINATACSVGTEQGFSIVQYAGNSTDGATIAHGLSKPPDFYMCKVFSGTTQGTAGAHWRVGHKFCATDGNGLTYDNSNGLYLSLDNAASANSHGALFAGTPAAPNNNVMIHKQGNGGNNQHFHTNMTGHDYIMYAWHDVPGLQKFGVYKGSGGSGGNNFIMDCGFEPALIWIKDITGTGKWVVIDTTRRKDNANWHTLSFGSLYQNAEDASGATTNDFTSRGMVIRGTTDRNTADSNYIYCAWAQKPSYGYNNSPIGYRQNDGWASLEPGNG